MSISKAVATGLLTVGFSSALQAQDPISEKSASPYDLPPINTSLLKDMKMRVYDFGEKIKGGVRMSNKGLHDPILGFFCSWTEAVKEDPQGKPVHVNIVSRECNVVETDPEFLNQRNNVNFGTGYDVVTPYKPNDVDGDTIEVISRMKGVWSESYIRDWNSKENEVCVRYMVFQGKDPENATVKESNIIEQCIKFYADAEFGQFKADNMLIRRAMAP